jgi:Holliday junction DNA helicase RuvA
MIARLTGKLESIEGASACVSPEGGGLTYEVLLPAYLAERLGGRLGQVVTLVTLQYLESQNQGSSYVPRLIGFTTTQERDFFELFTTVKGIGNRKALRAMAVEPAAIARAITAKDARGLYQLPEIGKRLAETVIAELTGKVDGYLAASELEALDRGAGVAPPLPDAAGDAIAALMGLGETRPEAERLVRRAVDRLAAEGTGGAISVDQVLHAVYAGRS